jgi:predicted O-methyltransferase YrrM
MNVLSVLHSDASWWRAHMALPRIVSEHIDNPLAGVEVGVAFGSMSIWLTRLLPELQMICVDPFVTYDEADGMSELMEKSGDDIERLVRWRFANEGHGRLSMVRQTSEKAALAVADKSQDFVFIDADHRYEAVLHDINLWRPKVRSGGLLCGHDFCDGWPGVVSAVRESFGDGGLYDRESTIWFVRIP